MGSTAQRVAQVGKQSVLATAVAATAKFMGLTNVSIHPEITHKQTRYLLADYAPTHADTVTDERVGAKLEGEFSFEDFIMILDSSVKGNVTASGAGADKTWDFPFPLAANAGINTRTIEGYDGSWAVQGVGMMCTGWTLAGAATNDGVVTFTSDWMGVNYNEGFTTITPALTNRTFETLPVGAVKLYVDNIGGTVGTTLQSSTLISFNITYNSGLHLKKFADGGVSPSAFGYGIPSLTTQCTYEANAFAKSEVTKHVAGGGRLIRLIGTGSTVGAGVKTLRFDMAGDYTAMSDLWGDRDGNTTVDMTCSARLDSGAFGNYAKIQIINGVATLPG